MKNTIRRFGALCAMAAALCCITAAPHVAANAYGRGNYGSCAYVVCAPTQIVLPSGLKVSINLADGQVLPRSGYTITATPLNGQGSSFQGAQFYIDGVLASTVAPDETGTATWFWNTQAAPNTPNTTVRVTITDTSGAMTAQEFHVHIASQTPIGASSTTGQQPPTPVVAAKPMGVAALLDFASRSLNRLAQNAARTIRSLPPALAYSFPYILFGLLGLNILLLLYQMQREVREYHVLRSLLAREKMIAESKKTLMELVSHYLRTPVTIVLGGIDMLPKDSQTAAITAKLRAVANGMGTKIEGLITDTRTASEIALAERSDTALSATALWRQPGLFVPLLLILVVLVPYNYVARHGGALNITQVNLIAQAITFLALATVMYLVFRQLRLHKRDQQELRRLADTQATSSRIRDELIASTATTLRTGITAIDTMAGQLGVSQALTFIHEGQQRFHTILTRCTIAASLRGSRSTSQRVATTFGKLFDAAQGPLRQKIGGRPIHTAVGDTPVTAQNPELVSYVLHTVLDNALTYSQNSDAIDITAVTTGAGTDITVTDHGQGMPAGKIPLLFQPFFKAEGAEKFNHEGMGFSLYLDKLIMEYLGGNITLVSQKGHGTTVTLHLPA